MALLGVPGSQPGQEPSSSGVDSRTLDETPPTSVGVAGGRSGSLHSTPNAIHYNAGMESRLRSLLSVPLSLRRSGIPSGPLSVTSSHDDTKMTDASSSKDSEGSWVAEDDGSMDQEEQHASKERGQSSGQLQTQSSPTTLNLTNVERSETCAYELGEGSAGVVEPATCVTPFVTKEVEQVIVHVKNPAATSSSADAAPTTSTLASSSDTGRTVVSPLLSRLYTTNPFAVSTPRLSPVHETREEDVSLPFSEPQPTSFSLSLSLSL